MARRQMGKGSGGFRPPDTPAEPEDQIKEESRDDLATIDPTKSAPTEEGLPIKRKDTRRQVGEVDQMGNFQESAGGAVTNAAIPVQKPGIKRNHRIAYESKTAYRARVSDGVEDIPPSGEERDQDDSPGEKIRKGTSSRKATRQGDSGEEYSDDSWGKSRLAPDAVRIEPRFPPG